MTILYRMMGRDAFERWSQLKIQKLFMTIYVPKSFWENGYGYANLDQLNPGIIFENVEELWPYLN